MIITMKDIMEIKSQPEDNISLTNYIYGNIVDTDSLTEEEKEIMDRKYKNFKAKEIISYLLVKNLYKGYVLVKQSVAKEIQESLAREYGSIINQEKYDLLFLREEILAENIDSIDSLLVKYANFV